MCAANKCPGHKVILKTFKGYKSHKLCSLAAQKEIRHERNERKQIHKCMKIPKHILCDYDASLRKH